MNMSELYIQKNQEAGEYHIFDDDNQQCWGPFYNMEDARTMLEQIDPPKPARRRQEGK